MQDELSQAIEFAASGCNDEALAIYNRLLADDHAKAAVLGHRAWLYFQAKDFAAALRDYRELMVLVQPQDPEILFLIAECLIELNQLPEAGEALAMLLRQHPRDRRLLYLLLRMQQAGLDRNAFLADSGEIFPNPMARVFAATRTYFPAPVNQHLGLLLFALAANMRPDFIIEIGSYVGVSAIYLAQALKNNDHGHLYCFDLFNQALPDVTAVRRNQLETFTEHLRLAGLAQFVTPFAGDSSAMLTTFDLECAADATSMIFIDGDHTLQGVLSDFNSLRRLMNRNSLILLHDINYRHCTWMGPALLAKKLYGDRNYSLTVIPTIDHTDLALIQCKTAAPVRQIRPSLMDLILHKLYHLLGR
jgi:predicted O-methyltransferase YrrM